MGVAQVGVVVIRQAGTAAAFAPLVRRLRASRPALPLLVFCYPPARATWEAQQLDRIAIGRFEDAVTALPADVVPAFVLTGTSLDVADDARWWSWAAERSSPSTAFVDQWANYWQRFALDQGGAPRFDRLPDRIAVVDTVAAERMRALGCPSDRVIVSGSPAFDQLLQVAPDRVDALKRRLSDDGRAALLVFACEPPTPPQTSEDWRRRYGFCEDDVIALVMDATADVAARLSRPVHIVMKLHPIQVAHGTHPRCATHDPRFLTHSVFDGDRLELVAAADIVVGMRSMLLYEAALIGKSVVSVQPNRREACDLTDGRPGIALVGSGPALRDALFAQLLDCRRGTVGLRRTDADHAARFMQALELV